jgi:hypothetical protein
MTGTVTRSEDKRPFRAANTILLPLSWAVFGAAIKLDPGRPESGVA